MWLLMYVINISHFGGVRRRRERMEIVFTPVHSISLYIIKDCEFDFCLCRVVLDATLGEHLLVSSVVSQVSSINKTRNVV